MLSSFPPVRSRSARTAATSETSLRFVLPMALTRALRTAWPSDSLRSEPSTAVAICAVVGAALYALLASLLDTVASRLASLVLLESSSCRMSVALGPLALVSVRAA